MKTEGVVKVDALGQFRVRQAARNNNGQKVPVRRIIFRSREKSKDSR